MADAASDPLPLPLDQVEGHAQPAAAHSDGAEGGAHALASDGLAGHDGGGGLGRAAAPAASLVATNSASLTSLLYCGVFSWVYCTIGGQYLLTLH